MPYFVSVNPGKQLGQAMICLLLTIVAFFAACGLVGSGHWLWGAPAFGLTFFLALATYGGFGIWNEATSPNRRG